jgi:uncharacterized protein YqjF (DUF2071 family)
VLQQRWRDLTFLHWPVDPDVVAPLLPAGTEPDLFGGSTWVGLVPFRVAGLPLPFLETNVRLYAVDGRGRRGVVFRSLEASRLLPVLAARATLRLPYTWARMSLQVRGPERTYRTARRWPGPVGAGSTVRVRVGERLEPDPLADFLTARWRLFATWYAGRSVCVPVAHEPWTLHAAEVLDLADDLVRTAGLVVDGPPHVLWSPGVRARIGRPVRL